MEYTVKLSNTEIAVKDGFVLKDELNETLDSGTIQFVAKVNDINIEQFDAVEISGNSIESKKQLLDVFSSHIVEYDESDVFNSDLEFTVNLFSETKGLERIPCPSLTITRNVNNPATVYKKVVEYLYMYLPRMLHIISEPRVEDMACLRIDPTLESKLSMECPELSWNNPTLREVLTDLFAVGKLIPIVKYNVLTYIDLNARGNVIDTSKLSDINYEGVSSDYCDALFLPVENVIQTGTTRITEYISARADGARVGSNNVVFATSKPINRIIKVVVYAKIFHYTGSSSTETRALKRFDITDQVIEKSEFDAKSPQDRDFSNTDLIKDFSLFNLYFERGKRNIQHISDSTYFSWTFGSGGNYSKVHLAIEAKRSELAGNNEVYKMRPNIYRLDQNPEDVICLIEYEALDETTVSIGKETIIKNQQNQIFDGQSSSIVDLKRQVEQEYSKVNRLGNKIITIYGNYKNESEVPQLADTIDDYVLFSRELQYYDDFILFTGKMCKNYVLQNYFTGVLNEKRIFQLVGNDQATTRHDNIKFYVVACLEQDLGQSYYPYLKHQIEANNSCISWTLKRDNYYERYNLKHCFFTNENIEGKYGLGKFIEIDANYNILGRSFVVDFGFYDNIVAGNGMKKTDDILTSVPYYYTNDNGEFGDFFIELVNKYDAGDGDFSMANYISDLSTETSDFDNDKFNTVINKARQKPLVDIAGIDETQNRSKLTIQTPLWFKDNRERMKFSLQFEVCSGNDNVFIKPNFLETFRYFTDTMRTTKIYVARNTQYNLNNEIAKGEEAQGLSLSFNALTDTQDYVALSGDITLTDKDCWCIADTTGKIIIAVNGNHKKVCFEFRNYKDNTVYNNQIDREPIGKASDTEEELWEALSQHPAKITQIKVFNRTIDISDTLDVDSEAMRTAD